MISLYNKVQKQQGRNRQLNQRIKTEQAQRGRDKTRTESMDMSRYKQKQIQKKMT